jgi:1-hydroxy-2-naphthoate dioxygenase
MADAEYDMPGGFGTRNCGGAAVEIHEVRDIKQLDSWLAERNLGGHWQGLAGDRLDFKPFLWKWTDIYAALMKATEVVPMHETGRRTIQLRNPTLGGRMSNTIHMSVQAVLPGEVAEAHRHNAAAIRFVIQGVEGAHTVVEGEPVPMATGDLITTPSWTWHDHFNDGADPVIWLDVLDVRLTSIGQMIQERFPEPQQPRTKDVGFSAKTLGHVKASWLPSEHLTPPYRYPWSDTVAALDALRASEVEPDPYDGFQVTFTHPVHGGATLPTFACEIELLPAELKTADHRHISTTIYQAFRGSGVTVAGGERLEWSQGDIFVIPPWTWHHHEATDADALLFSVDDWPTLQALGLYREEGR